jgi:hypothetical protein
VKPNRPYFDERPASRGIFFANADRRVPQIVDGDIVTLRLGDISVIVLSIASISANWYRGTIVAFDVGLGPTCSGYSVGDVVEFSERQVFACSMP